MTNISTLLQSFCLAFIGLNICTKKYLAFLQPLVQFESIFHAKSFFHFFKITPKNLQPQTPL